MLMLNSPAEILDHIMTYMSIDALVDVNRSSRLQLHYKAHFALYPIAITVKSKFFRFLKLRRRLARYKQIGQKQQKIFI